jgi:Rrf2 family protein
MAVVGNGSVRISAKTDYALRAAIELASAGARSVGSVTSKAIADAQRIPLPFLLSILADLRRVGLVDSRRGAGGGWWLSRPATEITVADVIDAVDGPLDPPRPARPDPFATDAVTSLVNELWGAVRHHVLRDLEVVTIADLASGALPKSLRR